MNNCYRGGRWVTSLGGSQPSFCLSFWPRQASPAIYLVSPQIVWPINIFTNDAISRPLMSGYLLEDLQAIFFLQASILFANPWIHFIAFQKLVEFVWLNLPSHYCYHYYLLNLHFFHLHSFIQLSVQGHSPPPNLPLLSLFPSPSFFRWLQPCVFEDMIIYCKVFKT